MDKNHIDLLQRRVATLAIAASTLRSQGAKGMVRIARVYLGHMDLAALRSRSEPDFLRKLDRHTARLRRAFPRRAWNWGAARKSLNIFLRDVLYNAYLVDHYRLRRLEPWLEVPLDSHVATGIQERLRGTTLRWRTIKHLTPEESARYQSAARGIAAACGTARVHLDLDFWRRNEK